MPAVSVYGRSIRPLPEPEMKFAREVEGTVEHGDIDLHYKRSGKNIRTFSSPFEPVDLPGLGGYRVRDDKGRRFWLAPSPELDSYVAQRQNVLSLKFGAGPDSPGRGIPYP
jgi:hypothetical protein